MKTVLFIGSRGWHDVDTVIDCITTERRPFRGIVGDADGFDFIVWEVLSEFNLPRLQFEAKWRKDGYYNARAGHDRNDLMLAYLIRVRQAGQSATVIAGWDGKSPGTRDCVTRARRYGFDVRRLMWVPTLNKEA